VNGRNLEVWRMMRMSANGIALTLAAVVFGVTLAQADVWQQKTPPKQATKPAAKPKLTPAQEKALENYRKTCEPCHGPGGKSPLPDMTLADGAWKHGSSVEQVAKTIAEGVPGTVMMPNKDKFTRAEILELAKLVRSFDPKLKSGK
jgi:mono/diheme cytochrome c family protein